MGRDKYMIFKCDNCGTIWDGDKYESYEYQNGTHCIKCNSDSIGEFKE